MFPLVHFVGIFEAYKKSREGGDEEDGGDFPVEPKKQSCYGDEGKAVADELEEAIEDMGGTEVGFSLGALQGVVVLGVFVVF